MDDNTDDGFEGEENYYAILNISKSASYYTNNCSNFLDQLEIHADSAWHGMA